MNFLRYGMCRWGAVLLLVGAALPMAAAEPKSKDDREHTPVHDPAGMPFRMAPMAAAARSIVVPLSTNVHLAFDVERLRTHTVWKGEGLNLFGGPYHGYKIPFICTYDGPELWTTPPLCPWNLGGAELSALSVPPKGSDFVAISTKGGRTAFAYKIGLTNGTSVAIQETPRVDQLNNRTLVIRRFEVAACADELTFLAHSLPGEFLTPENAPKRTAYIKREDDVMMVALRGMESASLLNITQPVDYEIENITEDGTVKGNPRHRITGAELRCFVRIPPHEREISVEVATVIGTNAVNLANIANEFGSKIVVGPNLAYRTSAEKEPTPNPPVVFGSISGGRASAPGNEYYQIESFPLPKEIDLLVSGMDWLPNGSLVVSTWPGEVYIIPDATNDVTQATYRRFARGLHQPLGVQVVDGQIYVGQMTELTKLVDTDGNGKADWFESVCDAWGFSGSYDSFMFGPVLDKEGNFVFSLGGLRGRWDVPYMGWVCQVNRDGSQFQGIAAGLRQANGIVAFGPDRDIFVNDQQGNWIGACKLNHVQPGKFFGFPSSTPRPESEYKGPESYDPPAVWFPYSLSPSTCGMAEIKDDRFGPFKGQLLVSDFKNSTVARVQLEKVNGQWQGAVWPPMLSGFASAANRLTFGPLGKLYVGGLKRTWPANAPAEYSLDRVKWTGKVPFEVKEVHALTNGLELTFTQPVDAGLAADVDTFDVVQFNYHYHKAYGSPEYDFDGKENSASEVKVVSATVSEDGLKVALAIEGWRTGYVTKVRLWDLVNTEGTALWHDTFYYTLNQLPAPQPEADGATGL